MGANANSRKVEQVLWGYLNSNRAWKTLATKMAMKRQLMVGKIVLLETETSL